MALEHPALKDFSPTWEGFKHVAGKALKWAALGAVVLGALVMAPAAITGLATTVAGWFGLTSAAGTSLLVGGLIRGAVVGAALGAISGLGGVFKGVEEAKQDTIADYNMTLASKEREMYMAQARNKGFANSEVSVGNPAFRGRGQNQGQGIGG